MSQRMINAEPRANRSQSMTTAAWRFVESSLCMWFGAGVCAYLHPCRILVKGGCPSYHIRLFEAKVPGFHSRLPRTLAVGIEHFGTKWPGRSLELQLQCSAIARKKGAAEQQPQSAHHLLRGCHSCYLIHR